MPSNRLDAMRYLGTKGKTSEIKIGMLKRCKGSCRRRSWPLGRSSWHSGRCILPAQAKYLAVLLYLLLCSKRWWVCMENVLTVEGTSLHRILVSITQSCLAHVGVSKLHTLDIVLLLDEHMPVL